MDFNQPNEIDWVILVRSGEPLLHSNMGYLIRQVKIMTDLPVAVITNGALLHLPEVRLELVIADAVLPSLDAGTPAHYPVMAHSQRTIPGFRKHSRRGLVGEEYMPNNTK